MEEEKQSSNLNFDKLSLYQYNEKTLEEFKKYVTAYGSASDAKKFCMYVFKLYPLKKNEWTVSQREQKLNDMLNLESKAGLLLPAWFRSTIKKWCDELSKEKKMNTVKASNNKQALYSKSKPVKTYASINNDNSDNTKTSKRSKLGNCKVQ